jgi:hypothetical protein
MPAKYRTGAFVYSMCAHYTFKCKKNKVLLKTFEFCSVNVVLFSRKCVHVYYLGINAYSTIVRDLVGTYLVRFYNNRKESNPVSFYMNRDYILG